MPLSDITNETPEKRKELDLKSSTVNNNITKYSKDGLTTTKSHSGQPLALNERVGLHLVNSIRQNGDPLGIHSQNLTQSGSEVSLPTIRKYFGKGAFIHLRLLRSSFCNGYKEEEKNEI